MKQHNTGHRTKDPKVSGGEHPESFGGLAEEQRGVLH